MSKQEDTNRLSITLGKGEDSKEYKIDKPISKECCLRAYKLNEGMIDGTINGDEILHDLTDILIDAFGKKFTYEDVLFGIDPDDINRVMIVLLMCCGIQLEIYGETEKSKKLVDTTQFLYGQVVR